ncbi:hypothetical protein [Alteromonas sp. 14N.309.X.WAT.G.H12]|uniref:hypothetical protein n=1 Tax=Alteromonas sp. 14N.309.X.WAT.G.H12 TaxID=3120824 RepID=UPI002FD30D72
MKKADAELDNKLGALPKQIAPKRDLWRGIELSLTENPENGEERSGKGRFPLAIAASVLVGVLLASVILGKFSLPGSQRDLSSLALVNQLNQQHQMQVNQLLSEFKGQPALTQNWQEQLQQLTAAADAIRLALENDPNNPALLSLLQHVYQQQLLLIERVHAPQWQPI